MVVGADHDDGAGGGMPEPAAVRTPFAPVPLRLAVFDTSVLTCDVIAALGRGRRSSLVEGMRRGTVRGFVSHRVWAEVPRVLRDRHHEHGGFDLAAAEGLWWTEYIPLLFVVCTDGLPLTADVTRVVERDPSDAGTAALAALLAPAVVISSDLDLTRTGFAYRDWGQVRAALGVVADAESLVWGVTTLGGHLGKGTVRAVSWSSRTVRVNGRWALLALGGVLVGAVLLDSRSAPRRVLRRALRALGRGGFQVLFVVGHQMTAHQESETTWREAEYTVSGTTMLARVAGMLARAKQPMNRTQIVRELEPLPAELRRRDAMTGLSRMLERHPAFCETSPGRWQVGRTGVDFDSGSGGAQRVTGCGV